jgi:hypothetical protein
LWQNMWITPCAAIMEKMLDAGFCLPATCPLVPCMAGGSASPSGEAGGDTGFIKVIIFFYQASSIQYLRHSGINVRFQNFVFFGFRLVRVMILIINTNLQMQPERDRIPLFPSSLPAYHPLCSLFFFYNKAVYRRPVWQKRC